MENALLEELEDIKERSQLIAIAFERCIQIFALGGISNDIPMKLSNPMFKKYYSDISPKLGSSQRKSFELIDAYLDTVNSGIDTLRENHLVTPEKLQPATLNNWGELLKGQYSNVATAFWHVKYHLANKDHPFLDMEDSNVHESYINQLKSSE